MLSAQKTLETTFYHSISKLNHQLGSDQPHWVPRGPRYTKDSIFSSRGLGPEGHVSFRIIVFDSFIVGIEVYQ